MYIISDKIKANIREKNKTISIKFLDEIRVIHKPKLKRYIGTKLDFTVLEEFPKKALKDKRRRFVIEGEVLTGKELEFKLKIEKNRFYLRMNGVKKALVNGFEVETVLVDKEHRVPFLYDGKHLMKDLSYKDMADIFDYGVSYVRHLCQTGKLEKSTGYRIYYKNPTGG